MSDHTHVRVSYSGSGHTPGSVPSAHAHVAVLTSYTRRRMLKSIACIEATCSDHRPENAIPDHANSNAQL